MHLIATPLKRTLNVAVKRQLCNQRPLQVSKSHVTAMAWTPQTPGPQEADDGVVLVSFDVDGTLIESIGTQANHLHKAAFSHGFKHVFGVDTHIDVVKHHGSTDPLIVIKVLEHHGFTKQQVMEKLPEVEAAMIEFFTTRTEEATVGLAILPGVRELLTRLKAHGKVATCLVTGNLEPIGWTKMQYLGLKELFTEPHFGGFGTDFCSGNAEESWKDRAEFVNIAAGKCGAGYGKIKARFHVGDTPMDIQAALAAGAVPLGVATGIFCKADLDACIGEGQAGVVLDNLADTDAVLKVMGVL